MLRLKKGIGPYANKECLLHRGKYAENVETKSSHLRSQMNEATTRYSVDLILLLTIQPFNLYFVVTRM